MLDFRLASSAISTLLSGLEKESASDRYKTYTTIVHLLDDIETHSRNSGIDDWFIHEKILELRVTLAHAAGLRDNGSNLQQNVVMADTILKTLVSGLDYLQLDPVK
ncbi:hypothetical protein DGMP_08000 [Desulfomarina profundi]|uniref:Uncharacterized protein n=1 Tax=Desulfomarina profundi TaxID=2772557 RepID=A0A8D5FUH3_9BACT|nr:hypothetical protein [Desulfomarina profundi]BCL60107.1 hypothetical protein DGMP_08000 [Desulfomarina profundi]